VRDTTTVPHDADPQDGALDDSAERRRDDDAQRYPGHDDPDALREQAGLSDEPDADSDAAPGKG
jgi:hypothetical protein